MKYAQLVEKLSTHRGRWSLLADLAGVNRATIARMIAGGDYNPRIHTIEALERALRELGRGRR